MSAPTHNETENGEVANVGGMTFEQWYHQAAAERDAARAELAGLRERIAPTLDGFDHSWNCSAHDVDERLRVEADCDCWKADLRAALAAAPTPTLPQDAGERTRNDNTPVEAALLAAEGAVESGFTRTSLDWLELLPMSPECSNPRCVRRYAHDGPCLTLAAAPTGPTTEDEREYTLEPDSDPRWVRVLVGGRVVARVPAGGETPSVNASSG